MLHVVGISAVAADVYGEVRESLVRFASLLTGSREEAEDVVQDVFLRIGDRMPTLEHPESYLRAAVLNAVRSLHRREVLARAHIALPAEPQEPRSLVELRDVLLSLPERQRVVLVLRYFVDLSDEDIASTLGCRRSTVRSLARRGLARLREVLP